MAFIIPRYKNAITDIEHHGNFITLNEYITVNSSPGGTRHNYTDAD